MPVILISEVKTEDMSHTLITIVSKQKQSSSGDIKITKFLLLRHL
jgi:hypothetical protein